MDDELRDRLETVERALTDGETDLAGLAGEAAAAERLDELETTVEDLESQVAEQEAAIQAVRGYVGNVRSVNREVARRADAALAAADDAEDPTRYADPGDENSPGRGGGGGGGGGGPSSDSGADPAGGHGGRSDRCVACGRSSARTDHSPEDRPADARPVPGPRGHDQVEGRETWPQAAAEADTTGPTATGGAWQPRNGDDKIDRLARTDGSHSAEPSRDDSDGSGWAEERWRREDSLEGRARHSDRATENDTGVDRSVLARVRNLL